MRSYSLTTLLALILVAMVAPYAFADTAPAAAVDTSGQVYVMPLVTFLKPYIDVIVQAIIGGAVIFVAGIVQRYTGVQINQTALDKIRAAAATQAGILIAGAEDNLAKTTITVGHPLVAEAANRILASLPEASATVGATPAALQALIVGEVGKLQASGAGTPTATATSSSPDGSSTTVTAKG